MNSAEGVFVTDGINRQRALLPLAELMRSMEGPLLSAIANGMPPGMPLNVDHDKCRQAGWSVPGGIYIAKDMARQLGSMFIPDTDKERAQIAELIRRFEIAWVSRAVEPYQDALLSLSKSLPDTDVRYWHVEAAGCVAPGLAATAVPAFFDRSSELVDKDGLVDYSELLERTIQIHPGVFHEPKRDILLFAHPFFRRSLSRRNSLNSYFLRSFDQAAKKDSRLRTRLRLDPDLLAVPASGRGAVMELEYWHGPKYDDSIETIASGVAEHKDDSGSGIDRTHIWWKDPESRQSGDGTERQYRTFEIEELIEKPSPGLEDEHYGCRYAHAEYDLADRTISHFDGAIRAYPTDTFLERIERRIDRAGKNSLYTKLFRFDGALPVDGWKRVLTDFYRGNRLIPEYLGAPPEDRTSPLTETKNEGPEPVLPELSAYVALHEASRKQRTKISLLPDQRVEIGSEDIEIAEIGTGHIAEAMRRWADDDDVATMAGKVEVTNLAKIILPDGADRVDSWRKVADSLGSAIQEEASVGNLAAVSVAVEWSIENVAITLSIAGKAGLVAKMLKAAMLIVRPDDWPNAWVEAFRDELRKLAPDLRAPVAWPNSALRFERIVLERSGEIDVTMSLPKDIADHFADGAA